MTTIVLPTQIIALEKISIKNTGITTFKDIISLIFYAIQEISKDTTNPDSTKWAKFYREFEEALNKQNRNKWPQLSVNRNDYSKRMDVYPVSAFTKSKNLLILLLRLLYIENYKASIVSETYKYHKILTHNIPPLITIEVTKLSLTDLIDLLKTYIQYYLRIYDDDDHFEHHLGQVILNQLS